MIPRWLVIFHACVFFLATTEPHVRAESIPGVVKGPPAFTTKSHKARPAKKLTLAEFEVALLQDLLAAEREALAEGESAFGRSWFSLRSVASTIARRHAWRVSQLESMLVSRGQSITRTPVSGARGTLQGRNRIAALRGTRETEFGHRLAQLMREHVSKLKSYSASAAQHDVAPEILEFLRAAIADDEFDLRLLEQRAK